MSQRVWIVVRTRPNEGQDLPAAYLGEEQARESLGKWAQDDGTVVALMTVPLEAPTPH